MPLYCIMIYIGGHGIWYCTVLFVLAGDVCYDMTDWYSSGECEYAVVEYSNVAIDRPDFGLAFRSLQPPDIEHMRVGCAGLLRPEDAHGMKWGGLEPLIPPIKLSRRTPCCCRTEFDSWLSLGRSFVGVAKSKLTKLLVATCFICHLDGSFSHRSSCWPVALSAW